MIIEALINLITLVIKLLATPFSILPSTPIELENAMNYYMNLIFENVNFIGFFVHVDTLKAVALIAIAIWSLDKLYNLLMWIIHKLPISID